VGNFSVFVRVPQSLERGELSLQRVAYLAGADHMPGKSSAPLLCRVSEQPSQAPRRAIGSIVKQTNMERTIICGLVVRQYAAALWTDIQQLCAQVTASPTMARRWCS